jgi:ketosteroid isomerase-like protein
VIGAVLAKREVRKGFDAINRHDLDTLVGMFADDSVWEFPAGTVLEGRHEGTDAVRDWFGYWFERMPEIHFTLNHVAVENIFAMGATNVVYVEWDLDETDTDGQKHHLTGVTAFDIVHGKVKFGKDYIFEQQVLAGIYPREKAQDNYPKTGKTL